MINITAENLSTFISSGESETVEFKESFNDETLETIGALSNARGGIILVGVTDSGKIIGFQTGKKTLEDIANRIQEASDPRLQPSLSLIAYEEKNILLIQIHPSNSAPVSIRGRFFKRVGKTNQRMSHEEIMQRLMVQTGSSWDAYIQNNAALSDLNADLIKEFFLIVREKGRLSIPEHASDEEILKKLELIRDNKPSRAALLLFGNKPQSFFGSAFLKIGRFRSPTHIVDDRESYGTLLQQLEGAMSWFRERLETEFIITGEPAREVRWEYPLQAIREAITNVLCHRDYLSEMHSQIRLYDDHLVIRNAGSLPHPLTPEALFRDHDSIPRNRKIAEAFFYAGLIERWGSGTTRIAEELERAHLPKPIFESESGRFKLVFYKQFSTREYLKMELSKRQLKVIAYIKEHGRISNIEYQAVAKVSKRTASRELNELKEKGVLILEGTTGRGTIYKLKGP